METLTINQTELPKPKNNTAEVLYTLLKYGSVSLVDFPYLQGLRTRLSELRLKHQINLTRKQQSKLNKFGRRFNFVEHYLPADQKEKALQLYNEINS